MPEDERPPRTPTPAWAHNSGILSMQPPQEPAERSAAIDRLLIVERMSRYCWGFDEHRPDLLGACFTDEAVWEGNVAGDTPVAPIVGRQKIIDWLGEFWARQVDQRRHMLLNSIVEEQSDTEATSLSYLLLMSAKDEQVAVETMGFYRLKLVRDDGAWRIAHLFAGFDAPFWPGKLKDLSKSGKRRHGVEGEERS